MIAISTLRSSDNCNLKVNLCRRQSKSKTQIFCSIETKALRREASRRYSFHSALQTENSFRKIQSLRFYGGSSHSPGDTYWRLPTRGFPDIRHFSYAPGELSPALPSRYRNPSETMRLSLFYTTTV